MMARELHSPRTSSAGRLFDAIASITGVRHVCRFEGQAAMELEFLTHQGNTNACYGFELNGFGTTCLLDWEPMVREIIDDVLAGVGNNVTALKFHNTLAEMVVSVARKCGEPKVALSGGCFQNRYLTERVVKRLREEGFQPYWHQRVPPNDGGIALGQVAAVSRLRSKLTEREGRAVCA
jgi:hydrogenase maturation protein HypF